MRVLLIVHATAWSDQSSVAKEGSHSLVTDGGFDQILEVIQSRPDIRDARYLVHEGLIFEHDEISPVRFFREGLFGDEPLFPTADAVTLVGGVLNYSGGCLNVAFDFLVRHLKRLGQPCVITVPFCATYREHRQPTWDKPHEKGLVVKDFAWKMLVAGVPFELVVDDGEPIVNRRPPLVRLRVET